MKYIRKKLLAVLMISILLASSFGRVSANNTIYDTITTEKITSGVNLQRIVKFTDEGWLRVNVLKVDLQDPNVKVDTLTNKESINKLTNTKILAESNGAVAAVNASFFNWMKEAGKGYPCGPTIQSGEFTTADTTFNSYQDSMATFSLDNLNNVLFDYWKTHMEIISSNATPATVTYYNRPSLQNYNDITIWSRKWSKTSLGASEAYPDLLEMVVDNGIVKEIRRSLPAVEIPVNGYVVISRGNLSQFLEQNYKVGDSIGFSISTKPDWDKVQMAVTGSAVLVKDGKIPSKFSFDQPGRSPRTAVGSTANGNMLLLVTVDGRQEGSIGVNQTEFAQLLISLGVHNAIALDGGGSTTMVARPRGSNEIKIVNTPSDSSPRSVTDAIGIFSIMPPAPLEGFIIDTEDTNMFVNTSRTFTVKGFDTYFNPAEVDESQIEWSVSGIKGSFKGNVLYAESEGTGTVTARIGKVWSTIQIKCIGKPDRLVLSNSTLKIPTGKTYDFTVKGSDRNGYTAYINPLDVEWSVSGDFGKFDNNTFTATKKGVGYIEASLGNARSYCAVSVAAEQLVVKDSFESQNGSFLSAPSGTPGSYELSEEIKVAGKYSGKLTYDFSSNLQSTRAAYLVFPENGIAIDSNTTKIGIWVYNTHENTNWLRAELVDGNGEKQRVDFKNGLDWTGWKYLEASVDSIKSPAKLTRIYIAQVNDIPDSGEIYFEQLSFKNSTFLPFETEKIPQDTMAPDEANKKTEYSKDNSFRFSIFGAKGKSQNLLERLLLSGLSEKLKENTDIFALFDGADISKNMFDSQIINADKGYNSFIKENIHFIQLDTSKNGLRKTATGQWQWFLSTLKSSKTDNVFIIMKDPLSSFSDKGEADLFKKVITEYKEETGKNIWVFHKDKSDRVNIEKGIRYFSVSGMGITGLSPENAASVKYLEITVQDDNVTYQYVPLID